MIAHKVHIQIFCVCHDHLFKLYDFKNTKVCTAVQHMTTSLKGCTSHCTPTGCKVGLFYSISVAHTSDTTFLPKYPLRFSQWWILRSWSFGTWHHVMWQTSIEVLEKPAKYIFTVEDSRWRQQVPSNSWCLSTTLHSVTIQKTVTSDMLCSVYAKASSQSTYDTWNRSAVTGPTAVCSTHSNVL